MTHAPRSVPLLSIALGVFLLANPAARAEPFASPTDPDERAELLDYGAYLSNDCVSCHRIEPGRRRAASLAGLPEDLIYEMVTAFRTEKRHGGLLRWVIDEMSPRDVRALSMYFASLPQAN